MINYKILAFDQATGNITINFEGYQPVAYFLPIIDGVYITGIQLNTFVNCIFSLYGHQDFNGPVYAAHKALGADAVLALIDSKPFEVTVNSVRPPPEYSEPLTLGLDIV